MKPLARFVIRPANDEETAGDLILGIMFRSQNPDLLKPGRVYQIEECLGILMIKDVGPSAIAMRREDSLIGVAWVNSVEQVIRDAQKYLVMTRGEVISKSE